MKIRLSSLSLLVACVALTMLVLCGPGTRLEIWNFRTGLTLLKYSTWASMVGAPLAFLALLISWRRSPRAELLRAGVALIVSLAILGFGFQFKRVAASVPRIHDITTDTENPPAFAAILPLRAGVMNSSEYGGPQIAAQQNQAYPEITPLTLALSAQQSFEKALGVAKSLGWEIVASDPASGRIEATDTTFWFGFKDDIVIRIRPQESQSRIDVRSLSRVGISDLGKNAARIRDFLNRLKS